MGLEQIIPQNNEANRMAPSGMGQIQDGVLRGNHHIGFEQTTKYYLINLNIME